ncbi:glycosyltransferase [Marinoscillum furvescens]|uniref:Glycosyltransferase involved in cell wall biosynthesis n=1 Tax=Marinoscillum furvescens DSM 4134 TaxID=1122208 RepID=A0A3D9L4Y9_MARFU|nr:glycosyltransferase [Marinoscillum furvescens]RED99552.1 glycosyltransferase involved in cell wall biosynthesis [Marinoscillum furvescens DSM 4134]
MAKNTLVFIYNSFNDPLFQNLMLSYLKTLTARHNVGRFYLITFEQKKYQLSPKERARIKSELESHHIYWRPLTFHSGKLLLLKKAWDFSISFLKVLWIRVRHQTQIIFCFANVSASFGYVFSKLMRMKLMIYSYEPHSEFMVDLGYWSTSDLKYRLLNSLEWKAGMHADVVMTGTQWMVDELKRRGSKAELYRAPTAVDPEIFKPDLLSRTDARKALGYSDDDHVFIYVGKFGGLYYVEGIPRLCQNMHAHVKNARFLIVTSNDHLEMNELFSKYLPEVVFKITGNLSQKDLIACMNASDFGISGVPPSPNQKYRSPTKVAEYLMVGLPYITTEGVAEDDVYAMEKNIGVVTSDFNVDLNSNFYEKINSLLEEDKEKQVSRIRSIGLEYRSKEKIDKLLVELYSVSN